MKHLLFILLLIISLHAQHVNWRSGYDSAHQDALKTNKLLMVLLIDKECPACHKMLRETFTNQAYIETINELFVSVIVTKDQFESYPIEMLYTMEYPAVFFLDKHELFIGDNIFGYMDSNTFKKHLNLHVN